MWTRLFDHALPAALFEHLHAHVSAQPGIEALSEHSFWFPMDARPRLYVEHAVLALTRLLPTMDGLTGAEWWVPAMKTSQGMEWHCDCDRIIYHREKRFVRPRMSSVFYVSTVGGPTLVADQTPVDHRLQRPRSDRGCVVFLPAPNRYGIFPGDRFHAVAISEGEQRRVTLAINWWTEKPSAPLCIDVPYGSLELAPFTAPSDFQVVTAPATAVAPIQMTAQDMAALPHRKYCPIYAATI